MRSSEDTSAVDQDMDMWWLPPFLPLHLSFPLNQEVRMDSDTILPFLQCYFIASSTFYFTSPSSVNIVLFNFVALIITLLGCAAQAINSS